MTSRFPPFAFVELVSPYNKKNITRWLEDMNFMFSWQEQYLTRSLRSLVRYCSCHSNIKFISSRHSVISSMYQLFGRDYLRFGPLSLYLLKFQRVHVRLRKRPSIKFFYSNFRSLQFSEQKVSKVLTYSPNFTSSVLGEGLCDRNFIASVEANNYHHMYLTLFVHNLTFLITMIC